MIPIGSQKGWVTMIKNQWYAVLNSNEVEKGSVKAFKRMGESLVFWRDLVGNIFCFEDRCPHRGVALSKGKIVDGNLQCPFHGFQFDGDGECCLVPANGRNAPKPKQIKAKRYPTFEVDGFIFIYWGETGSDAGQPQFFDNLMQLSYGTAQDPWRSHYSRVIENQLDVAHLPFIHHNSIGRGNRTLVDGPLVEWENENKFFVYVFNRLDDGRRPKKPKELNPPSDPFHLEFIFPNLWQNYISPDVRVVAAFVPVDDQNTILYLRFYQGFLKIPVIKDIVNWMSMPMNLYIAHQDRGIVETHIPARSELRIGEKLIQADWPIVQYRKRREELMAISST
mgnify:CR=1 FL=1